MSNFLNALLPGRNTPTITAAHPYFPLGTSLPSYIPNTMTAPVLVTIFAAGSAAILLTSHFLISLVRRGTKPLSRCDTFAALWFTLCGFIHLFFEGYFAYNFDKMPSQTDIFGQLWKEYSLSDSRYLSGSDSFVVTMETVTAILWGPLSFVIAYTIATGHPLRHPLQLIVSMGQLYGDVLYYATATFAVQVQGVHYCRPEDFYFWAYYFLCNAFWIVIPFALIVGSVKAMKGAFETVQKLEGGKKKQ